MKLINFLLFSVLSFAQAVQYSTTLIINNPPPGNYSPNFIQQSKIFVNGTTYMDSTASVSCPGSAQIVLPATSACVSNPSALDVIAFWLIPGTYSFTVQLPAGQILGPFPFVASGQFPTPQFPASIFVITVSQLPAASSGNNNYVYLVTDGISSSDCSTGGGSTQVWCASNGTSWNSLGGGGGGGSTTIQVNGTSTTSQNPINFVNANAFNGLSLNVSNPASGQIKNILSGTLNNAGLTNSTISLSLPSWLNISGSPASLGSGFTVTPTTAQTSHQVIGTCGSNTTFTPCLLDVTDLPTGYPYSSLSGAPTGGGTVTDFSSGNFSPLFTTTVGTSTTTPTLNYTAIAQNANLVFASPTSGTPATPTFRSIVSADIPTLNQNTTGSASVALALATTPTQCSGATPVATGIAANGNANCTNASNGTVTSVATTSPVSGGTITGIGTISCPTCVTGSSLTSGELAFGSGSQGIAVGNLTGDATTSGTSATKVIAINNGSIPVSAAVLATNGLAQPVLATSTGVVSLFSACTGVQYLGADGACHTSGTGTLTSVATTSPIAGGTITTAGTITCTTCVTSATSLDSGRIILGGGSQAVNNGDLSGDVTTSGTAAVTVSKINGGSFPASTPVIGSNSSSQPIAATAAQIISLWSSCSGTEYLGADGTCHSTSGAGTVTSIATSSPLGGGTITTTGTLTCVTCVTSASALTSGQLMFGSGLQASAVGDLTGDVTTSGTSATTVAAINGVAIPTSALFLGTNGSQQLSALTATTATADLNLFTSSLQGLTPSSGGGTSNFLRADGSWAAPSGSGTVTAIATTGPITGGTITSTGTIACATCVTSASALTSGKLMTGAGSQASQVSDLTGDVTTSGSTATTVVAINGTTVPTSALFLGTNSSAQPIALTSTTATADLNLFTSSLQGLTPSSGGGTTNYLRADGSWAAPAGVGTVTTTGSPATGNLTKFSGSTSITNGDLSGDASTSGTLTTTVGKVNGVSYGNSPSTNTVPVVTGTNTVTYEAVPNAALTNSALTVTAGTGLSGGGSVSLGSSVTLNQDTASIARTIGAGFDGGGSVLKTGSTATVYFTVPFACTISAWNITVDTGTITFDVWKVATGTAIPTVTNTITASALPAISTGTAIHSTTLTGWTTAVSANDIFGINVNTVATATKASLTLQCNVS